MNETQNETVNLIGHIIMDQRQITFNDFENLTKSNFKYRC